MNEQPCSKEAEYAVIGSVLINPSCFKEIDLTSDDFFFGSTKETWNIFQELSFERKVIDHLTVMQRATEKSLESTIGINFLTQTTVETPSSVNFSTYSEIVKDKAKRRKFIKIANDLANFAYDEKQQIDEKIPSVMNSLINSSRPEKSTSHISTTLSDLYDDIQERITHPQDIYGLSTGIPGIDRITGGLQKGEVFLLSGEPGLGKSLLAMQLGFSIANESHPGAIYEMEMSAAQTLRRTLSVESGIKVSAMKSGRVKDDEQIQLANAFEKLESLPVYFSDSTSWTTASLRSDLTRLKLQNKIEWFIVDYLRLMKDRYGKDDHERLAYIGSSLHDIAKDLKLAGLVIHSMNKQGIGGSVSMASLSGSGQISYDVDTIAVLQKDSNDPNLIAMTFEKLREGDGDSRMVRLSKKAGFPQFAEVAKPQFANDHK